MVNHTRLRIVMVSFVLVALIAPGFSRTLIAQMASTPGAGAAPAGVGPPVPQPQEYAVIPIYAVRTADDNGSNAASVTASKVQSLIVGVNEIFADAGIQFTFDPAQDFPPVINDTLLNQDCTLAPDADMTNIEQEPACDAVPHAHAREAFAVQHNDHVVVLFRWGTKFKWVGNSWQVQKATQATSSHCALRVRMTASGGTAAGLAHELGHYFHCLHTFSKEPVTVTDAETMIWDYVVTNGLPKSLGLDVFDGDGLSDTPPDAGPNIFMSVGRYENACLAPDTIPIEVDYYPDFPNYPYLLNPDQGNVMSYFISCPGSKHFSSMQIARIRASLEGGNRSHLIGGQRGAHMELAYEGTWPSSTDIFVSFTLDERPHILAYGPNGTVRINKVNDTENVTTVWSGTWSNQYTSIVPLELNGVPYLLLYKKATGYVRVVQVNAGGQGVSAVWAGTWSLYTDYTNLVPFTQDGFPHALMYRKDDGRVNVLKFTGVSPAMIWTGTWSAGYTSFMPFSQDGQPRVLLYQKDSGYVKVVQVNAGAQGVSALWNDFWSTGYISIALLRRGGVEPHALLYKDVGSAGIVEIKPDGGVTGVWSDWWSTGYTAIVPFHILHPGVLLYKAGSGSAQILRFCL